MLQEEEFCLLWLFLCLICAHSLLDGFESCLIINFGRWMGGWALALCFQGVSGLGEGIFDCITIYGCFRQRKVVFQDLPSGYSLCPCTVWSLELRAIYSSFFFCKGCLKSGV